MNTLIQTHSGLVYSQLHKFKLIHDQEAESIAFVALYNALKNFDASKGNAISTVATVYIYNALGTYVRSLHKQRQLNVISYNNLANFSNSSDEHEYLDTLASEVDIEKDYIRKELGKMALDTFDELYVNVTNEKHKTILSRWKESDFAATTTYIAKQVNVSQSYVSQVINNFKFKMKRKLEEVYYD